MFVPIVGMRFHPPAEGIIKALPAGFEVVIVAEPTNPYDDKALRVLVDMRRYSSELDSRLDAELERFGLTSEICEDGPPWMLGYVAKPRPEKGIPHGNTDVWAWFQDAEEALLGGVVYPLAFDSEGAPVVNIAERYILADDEWAALPVANPNR